MKRFDKFNICLKSVLALMTVILFASCDEINDLISGGSDNDKDKNEFVYLYSDGKKTNIYENQTVKVMDEGNELFVMKYNPSLRFEILKSSDNPEYFTSMMYVGRFNSIDDVMIPAYPRWGSSAEIIEQGGIIVKVENASGDNTFYLRLFISSCDYNSGKMTIQCEKIGAQKLEYSAPRKATIEKGKTFVIADENPYLALFNLENAYPVMKLKSNYSGQKNSPVIDFSGIYDSEKQEFPPMQEKWAESAEIAANGVYYAKVETVARGTKYVRFRISNIGSDESISIIYQIATQK